MRWEGREGSSNVEDRRGMPSAGGIAIGGGLGTLVILFLAVLLGANPNQILQQVGPPPGQGQAGSTQATNRPNPAEEPLRKFVGVVLKDTEDVWREQFASQLNKRYVEPKLVLFTGQVRSACGVAGASVGPFYCPGDSNVYLDLSFFKELAQRHNAAGDLAMAYVVSHEVGHHVQNLLGISQQVQQAQARASQVQGNQLSVRTELQADYLAGVFIHHAQETKNILERGDLEEAINAAAQIGDDTLQRQANGRVQEQLFTHGSSAQRMYWLTKGIESGDLNQMMLPFEMTPAQLEATGRKAISR